MGSVQICTFGTKAPPCYRLLMSDHESGRETEWMIPEEIPVAMVYNGRNYAVMLATPDDLADFAIGFALSEQIIEQQQDLLRIDIHMAEYGADIRMSIVPERQERLDLRQKRRNLIGRSGCGVCGLDNADSFFSPLPRISENALQIDPAILKSALAQLEQHQTLNRRTRSVHAAAFATLDGSIIQTREDVGRHNALDKLLGGLVQAKIDTQSGFVLMSSRCSYEIIEKAARCKIKAIASISGPTAFAIRKAKEANISLYCRQGDGFLQAQNILPET